MGYKSIRSPLFHSVRMLYGVSILNRHTESTGSPQTPPGLVCGGITLPAPVIPVCFVPPLLQIMGPW